MKTTSHIKEALLQVIFITAILLIASCSNNQRPQDTKDTAQERNDERFDGNKQEKDAQFLVNAAEIDLEEIHLGQLAQQKGKTTEVKELGKMMEDAHTKSLNDLKALAQRKGVSIPTSPTDNAKDAYSDLNGKSGDDFDKAYANLMVSKHQDAISIFEKASTDSNDSDMRNWATTNLPVLRTHLNRSMEVQKKFADMYLEENN